MTFILLIDYLFKKKDVMKMNERLNKEEIIRQRMSHELGVHLEKRKVKLEGIDAVWNADFVSSDGTIVGEIKTAEFRGKRGTAIPRNLCCPYLFLMHSEGAQKRFLIFTEESLYNHVKRSRFGKLAEKDGIIIKLMKL